MTPDSYFDFLVTDDWAITNPTAHPIDRDRIWCDNCKAMVDRTTYDSGETNYLLAKPRLFCQDCGFLITE